LEHLILGHGIGKLIGQICGCFTGHTLEGQSKIKFNPYLRITEYI
jgi:hypothetical protein